jgi:hypothetical protein
MHSLLGITSLNPQVPIPTLHHIVELVPTWATLLLPQLRSLLAIQVQCRLAMSYRGHLFLQILTIKMY